MDSFSPSQVPGLAYERIPNFTAKSITVGTVTCSISFTNVVFGDWANASLSVSVPGYEPAFRTQYRPSGQPAAPPEPMPATFTCAGTANGVLMP